MGTTNVNRVEVSLAIASRAYQSDSNGQQFNFIQQPLFHGDYTRFEDRMPVAYHSKAGLPNKDEIRLSNSGSSRNSSMEIHIEKNSSQRQHGYKNKVKTSATKCSVVSPTVRASGNAHEEKYSENFSHTSHTQRGKPTRSSKVAVPRVTGGTQKTSACRQVWRVKIVPQPSTIVGQAKWSKPSQSSEVPAPPIKRSGTQKTSACRQAWQVKIKAQPPTIANQSKLSSEDATPTHHITWNGLDELCEPIGQNCCLCEEDLSNALRDYESECYDVFDHPNLPDVAVLPCGHAFHDKCLEFITPEGQSAEPLCRLCSKF